MVEDFRFRPTIDFFIILVSIRVNIIVVSDATPGPNAIVENVQKYYNMTESFYFRIDLDEYTTTTVVYTTRTLHCKQFWNNIVNVKKEKKKCRSFFLSSFTSISLITCIKYHNNNNNNNETYTMSRRKKKLFTKETKEKKRVKDEMYTIHFAASNSINNICTEAGTGPHECCRWYDTNTHPEM